MSGLYDLMDGAAGKEIQKEGLNWEKMSNSWKCPCDKRGIAKQWCPEFVNTININGGDHLAPSLENENSNEWELLEKVI